MKGTLRLEVAVREDDVLHFLGYRGGRRPSASLAGRLEEAVGEARELASPRGAWRPLAVEEAGELGLEEIPAAGLVIGLVTIGSAIEELSSERLREGDAAGALFLDAAGSAAVEEAADRLGAAIVRALAPPKSRGEAPFPAESPHGPVSCRISPGYGTWLLAGQRALFERLPARALGIRLESSLLMVPRKTISFAMWLGADAKPVAGLAGCARCALASCRYRREPGA